MKLSYYIEKNMGEYIIKFIKINEDNVEIKLKCTRCNLVNYIKIKSGRVGRINCKNCNNRKIIVLNIEDKEVENIKIITEYNYNNIVKTYNESDSKYNNTKYEFIIHSLFKGDTKNYGANEHAILMGNITNDFKNCDNTDENIRDKVKNKRYAIDNNGITFKKIKGKVENVDNTIENNNYTNKMMDRLKKDVNDNFYYWCKNNGELGELVIKLYSKRKNKKKLNELTYDSKEEIWFNRGELKGLFSNTPYNITKELKIRRRLPNRYSYNKLFIYNYFSLLYEVELNKELFNKKVDIYIDEIKLALIYVGTTFNYERDIDKIREVLNYNDIRTIVIDGTQLRNNIKLVDDIITFKGNNKGKNIDNVLYDICSIVLKEYDMRSSSLPDINSIIRKMGLIY